MAKNRIFYQSQALYAGQAAPKGVYASETGTNDMPLNLQRIQNINYSFDVTRTDVNQFGQLANIDRVILESPTVSLDFSYYLANFQNENRLGFTINAFGGASTADSSISGMLNRDTDERNYYVRVVKEGADAVGYATGEYYAANSSVMSDPQLNDTVGIGNGFLASYSAEASVGDFPTASVTVEGLNIQFTKGTTGFLPKVDPLDGAAESTLQYRLDDTTANAGTTDYSVVRPGDITLTALTNGGMGANVTDAKIQSFNLSFDLAREPLNRLGTKFAFAREITFPVTVSLSVDALVGELDEGNLATLLDTDATQDDIVIHMKSGATNNIAYVLKQSKLDGHSYSNAIGDNKSVTMNFSTQIGSAQQNEVGLFMSGNHT